MGRIEGICCCPGQEKKSLSDLNLSEAYIARVRSVVGIRQRTIAEKGFTSVDLGVEASKKLLLGLQGNPSFVLFVTQTPDFFQPNNAHLLHERLGLSRECGCLDVNIGCSGWVYGLYLAELLAQEGKEVLLVCGDTMTKCIDPNDTATAVLFGDGVSATFVTPSTRNIFHQAPMFSSFSEYAEDIVAGGAFKDSYSPYLEMKGSAVFEHAVEHVPKEIVKYFTRDKQQNPQNISKYYFHQANNFIVKNIVKRSLIPEEKVYYGVLEEYGNLSSASIPFSLCKDKAKGRVFVCGFGTGFSVAMAVLNIEAKYMEVVDAETIS